MICRPLNPRDVVRILDVSDPSKECEICGGAVAPAVYRARADHDKTLVALPGIECQSCGAIQPDAVKIDAMTDKEVPSSVRIRCAEMRAVG
jgi:uncharacterized Zn finger protein